VSNKNQQAHEEVPTSIRFVIKCSEMCLSSEQSFEEKQSIIVFIVQKSCNVISFICKLLPLQPWSLSLAPIVPTTEKQAKHRSFYYHKAKKKWKNRKTKFSKIKSWQNIVKMGFMSQKFKSSLFISHVFIWKVHLQSRSKARWFWWESEKIWWKSLQVTGHGALGRRRGA